MSLKAYVSICENKFAVGNFVYVVRCKFSKFAEWQSKVATLSMSTDLDCSPQSSRKHISPLYFHKSDVALAGHKRSVLVLCLI